MWLCFKRTYGYFFRFQNGKKIIFNTVHDFPIYTKKAEKVKNPTRNAHCLSNSLPIQLYILICINSLINHLQNHYGNLYYSQIISLDSTTKYCWLTKYWSFHENIWIEWVELSFCPHGCYTWDDWNEVLMSRFKKFLCIVKKANYEIIAKNYHQHCLYFLFHISKL